MDHQRICSHFAIEYGDIFLYEDSPYSKAFQAFFNHCKGILDADSGLYRIAQPSFVYINDTRLNARVIIKGSNALIGINSGLMVWLEKRFSTNELLNHQLRAKYVYLGQYLADVPGKLISQMSMQFAFYHEFGHVLQKIDIEEISYDEYCDIGKPFLIKQHKMEIDADTFSSINVSAHIVQYTRKTSILTSRQALQEFIGLVLAGFMIYFINLNAYNGDVYYYEKSHPHPFVRIMNVITCVSNYMLGYHDIQLSIPEITKFIVTYSEIIEFSVLESDSNTIYMRENALKERHNLIEYLKVLAETKLDNYKSAVDQWNKAIDS
jgi:hypothetical protein